ncbi:SpoIIE family protein phosphatase [Kineococcus rhizosphaerae]|uniref:DNA-binding MarR family transcriptional regulator n=1 Tax=Kineococcus rhizosphaerae TaxID=559628 RepID=A0A2T0QZE2_9ACTN|nr:SpoIIE family protein phosphatase [Kineococcus rhizosphaerae]PRY12050.1 DNA-binding MarR family transcriptional regulator [Kineococcus rhizosphaerae]
MDDDLRRGLLKLSSDVLQGTMRAAEAIEPTVTPTQLRVLALLADTGPLSVSAVATSLGVAVSTASRLADRLSGAGLLVRQDGSDSRREVELALTRRGRVVAQRWADARVAVLADLLSQLEGPARASVEQGLRAARPDGDEGAERAGAQPDATRSGTGWAHPGGTAQACHALSTALVAADPHTVPDVLVAVVGRTLASDAVTLRLLSPDGRVLRPVSWTGAQDERAPQDEPVERSPAGQALREDDVVVEVDGAAGVVHAPVRCAGRCVAVLSVRWQDDADAGADVPPETWSDLLSALASTAGPLLPSVSTGSRRMHLAARTREWTVAGEVQARQSGPLFLAAQGVRASAHTEPSASGGAEAHDLEVVSVPPRRGSASDGRPAVHLDVAVLDCRSQGRHAAGVTGLALGALRHARSLGLHPAEQARLVDEAVFGEHHGEVLVDMLLLRVEFEPWRVHALASSDISVHRQRGASLQQLELAVNDALGLTGEADYATEPLDVQRGDRLVLVGDGFGPFPARGRRRVETVVNRSRALAAEEVVRQVITDLLDLAGADGPDRDATIVCLDL